MSRLVIFVLLATVVSCSDSADRHLARCNFEALKAHVEPRAEIVVACMRAEGYEIDVTHKKCTPEKDFWAQTACYRPVSKVGGAFWDLDALISNLGQKRN